MRWLLAKHHQFMKKNDLILKIKKDVADFLAKGGVIKQIPRGQSNADLSITQRKTRSIEVQKKYNATLFTDNNHDSSNT